MNETEIKGLSEALQMTGCRNQEDLIDMARVGLSLMESIHQLVQMEGPFKGWMPADDPAEIVFDLVNHLEDRASTPVGVPVPEGGDDGPKHDPSGLQAEAEDILERLKDAWDYDAVMGDACDMGGEWSRAAEWRWKRAKLALEIIRSTEPTPPVTPQVGAGDADARVEGALGSLPPIALHDIAAERKRQVEKEGWSADHDDAHDGGGLAMAAGWYALNSGVHFWSDVCGVDDPRCVANKLFSDPDGHYRWPWAPEWFKPKGQRYDLVRAGALIVAEIERLDRQQASMGGSELKTTPPQAEGAGR